ncbi:hypothetical protein [Halostella salina]|uniref:hypothetical protein n=1 Tax=Halostella salina TaxID=1547897 RepID=UPI000EF7B451|nr:hypothetical protein [Halostella salina]
MAGSSTTDAHTRHLTVRRTDSVPADARVRHVDELSDDARQRLIAVVGGDATGARLDGTTAGEFADGDVVVSTGYYEVDLT